MSHYPQQLTPKKYFIDSEIAKERWRREQKRKDKLRYELNKEKEEELRKMDYKSYIKMKDMICDNPTFKDYHQCNVSILKKMANVLGILNYDIPKEKLCRKIDNLLKYLTVSSIK